MADNEKDLLLDVKLGQGTDAGAAYIKGMAKDTRDLALANQELSTSYEPIVAAQQAAIERYNELADAKNRGGVSAEGEIEATQAVIEKYNNLRAAAKEAAAATEDLTTARQDSAGAARGEPGAGDSGGNLQGISSFRSFSSLAAIAGGSSAAEPIRLIGDLARLKNTLPDLAASAVQAAGGVGNLTLAMGAVGIAFGGVLILIKALSVELENQKRVLDAALKAQSDYYSAVSRLTTEQAKEQLAQLKAQQQAIQADLANTTAAINAQAADRSGLLGNQDTLAIARATEDARQKQAELQNQLDETNFAIGRFNDGIDQSAFALNDLVEKQKAYIESLKLLGSILDEQAGHQRELENLIRTGSVEDAQKKLDDLIRQRDQLQRNQSLNPLGFSEEDRQKLVDLNTQIAAFSDAVLNEIAARDAERTAVKDTINAFAQQTDIQQTLGAASRETFDALSKQIQGWVDQRAAILNNLGALSDLNDRYQAATQQVTNLKANIQQVTDVIDQAPPGAFRDGMIQVREQLEQALPSLEAEAEATKAGADAYKDQTRQLQQLNQLINQSADFIMPAFNAEMDKLGDKLSETLEKARQARDDAIANAQQQAGDAAANAERSANDARFDATQQYQDALSDLQNKSQTERLNAERDYREKLKQIQEQYELAAQVAIENRDAVALDRAQSQRDSEKQQASDDYKKKLADIDKSLEDQRRTIDRRYREQLATIDRRLQEQKADIDRRLQEQVAAAERRYSEAEAVAVEAYNKQLTDLENKLAQENNIRQTGYNVLIASAANFVNGLIALSNQLSAATVSSGGGTYTNTTGGTSTLPPGTGFQSGFAGGGYPTPGSLVRVGEQGPEWARFMSPVRVYRSGQFPGGGGLTMTLNGATKKTIEMQSRKHAHAVFDEVLDYLGA